jgi:hypothetical protein
MNIFYLKKIFYEYSKNEKLNYLQTVKIYSSTYIYIYTTSEKPVNDQSYGVLDRYGITILYK